MTSSRYRLLDRLAEDHRLEDRLTGSLFAWQKAHRRGEAEREDLLAVLASVGEWTERHHRREEVLFVALVELAEVPDGRGPLPVLRDEHERLDGELESLQERAGDPAAEPAGLADAVARHCRDRWEHLDKEEGVLLPESAQRLRREGVRALDVPDGLGHGEEARLIEVLEAFVERYPPADDPEVVRGEGCVVCREFAERCSGIEHEWWTAWEWAEIRARMQG